MRVMKRTISEVIDLIKQKKERAEEEFDHTSELSIDIHKKITKANKLIGTMEAYEDVLALLETSHLIEQEKVLEIIKKNFKVYLGKFLITNTKDEYEYTITFDGDWCTATISKEEYDVLNGVFKEEK